MTFTSTLAAATLGFQILSGTHVSGGGHTAICVDDQGRSNGVLLDFHEADLLHFMPLDLPPNPDNVDPNAFTRSTAHALLDRLAPYTPLRVRFYRSIVNSFFEHEAIFLRGAELPFIEDAHPRALGTGCHLVQAASQRERVWESDPLFLVKQEVWSQMASLSHRAGLMLHEIIYFEFRKYGHENSIPTRALLGVIGTNEFKRWRANDQQLFLSNLYSIRVPESDLGGLWLRLWDFSREADLDPSRRFDRFEFTAGGQVRRVRATLLRRSGLEHFPGTNTEVYEADGFQVSVDTPPGVGGIEVAVEFDERGQVRKLENLSSAGTMLVSEPPGAPARAARTIERTNTGFDVR